MGYLQFVLRDAEADTGLLDVETWRESPEEWRIGVEEHAIAVATARYDYVVPVLIELLAHAPAALSRPEVSHDRRGAGGAVRTAGGPRPRHYHRRLCRIAGLCKYAVEDEFLDHSPAAHVRRPSC